MKLETRQILRLGSEGAAFQEESLPLEREFQVVLNRDHFANVTVTPSQEREFLVGHLFSQGIIEDPCQIESLVLEGYRFLVEVGLAASPGSRKREVPSDVPSDVPSWTVRGEFILANLESTLNSELYLATGGTHTSALCQDDEILVRAEDVGRLNTLDKVFGWALLNGVDLHECYVATSGRITSHTMRKVIRSEIPLVASKGAVTTLAVDMANAQEVTLVGFARENRISVYAGASRISWG